MAIRSPYIGSGVVIRCSYVLTAQRAMHSFSSSKSSVAESDCSASTSPTSSCSTACERRKFHRACASDSLALKVTCTRFATRSSSVICDSCARNHSPTILGHGAFDPRTLDASVADGSGPSISAPHICTSSAGWLSMALLAHDGHQPRLQPLAVPRNVLRRLVGFEDTPEVARRVAARR